MHPLHQENRKAVGIRRVTSSNPCMILLARVERSGADKQGSLCFYRMLAMYCVAPFKGKKEK
eukprot:1123327-Pelagomonas_calceolata.AAC.2